jgi:hypothetical protein
MRWRYPTMVTALAAMACITAAGCGGSSAPAPTAQTSPSPTPSPVPSPSPAPSPSATATPQPTRTPVVAPVAFERLVGLIPELSGWTRTPPHGLSSTAGIPLSEATAEYTRADSTIKLEIMDSGYNDLILAPLSTMLGPTYSERSPEGMREYKAVAGSPGFESWRNDVSEGDVTVVVAGRYVITARGLKVPDLEPVRALVRAIDLAALAALR